MLRADHQEMADTKPVKVGAKVEVAGKGVIGTVAYIGTTLFSSGIHTDLVSVCSMLYRYLIIYISMKINKSVAVVLISATSWHVFLVTLITSLVQ